MNTNQKKSLSSQKKKPDDSKKENSRPENTDNEISSRLTNIIVDYNTRYLEAQKKAQNETAIAYDKYAKTIQKLIPDKKDAINALIAQQEYIDNITSVYSDNDKAAELADAYEQYLKALYQQIDDDNDSRTYTENNFNIEEYNRQLQATIENYNQKLEEFQASIETISKSAYEQYLLSILELCNKNNTLGQLVTAQRIFSDENMKITSSLAEEINNSYLNAIDSTLEVQKELEKRVNANAG